LPTIKNDRNLERLALPSGAVFIRAAG